MLEFQSNWSDRWAGTPKWYAIAHRFDGRHTQGVRRERHVSGTFSLLKKVPNIICLRCPKFPSFNLYATWLVTTNSMRWCAKLRQQVSTGIPLCVPVAHSKHRSQTATMEAITSRSFASMPFLLSLSTSIGQPPSSWYL